MISPFIIIADAAPERRPSREKNVDFSFHPVLKSECLSTEFFGECEKEKEREV